MKLRTLGVACASATAAAIPAAAHHSFAMFNPDKLTTLEGTVKQFQWTNPHSWIIMTVANANGELAEWAVEMQAVGGLARDGWKPKTLTPGMNIKVIIHPLRDGTNGGQYLAATLPDGTQMGNPSKADRLTKGKE